MRARRPDTGGYADLDGVKLHYEVFGDGRSALAVLDAAGAPDPDEPTILGWWAHARDPVRVNRLIREFAQSLPAMGAG